MTGEAPWRNRGREKVSVDPISPGFTHNHGHGRPRRLHSSQTTRVIQRALATPSLRHRESRKVQKVNKNGKRSIVIDRHSCTSDGTHCPLRRQQVRRTRRALVAAAPPATGSRGNHHIGIPRHKRKKKLPSLPGCITQSAHLHLTSYRLNFLQLLDCHPALSTISSSTLSPPIPSIQTP